MMSATAFYIPAPLILAALALDALVGDPAWLPHPVVLIGWRYHRVSTVFGAHGQGWTSWTGWYWRYA